MPLELFVGGVAAGFSLAVPIGPIGILCIKRTMTGGSRKGLLVGLSAALADIIYAAVAAFGVSFVQTFIDDQQHLIRIAGGLILLVIGFRVFRTIPRLDASPATARRTASEFFSTFLLALTNPLTLFGFVGALSGLGVDGTRATPSSLLPLLAGVFCGSFLWFTLITGLVGLFKVNLGARGLAPTNKIAGSLLMLFGVVAVWSGVIGF